LQIFVQPHQDLVWHGEVLVRHGEGLCRRGHWLGSKAQGIVTCVQPVDVGVVTLFLNHNAGVE
jgi:hypothetical protein